MNAEDIDLYQEERTRKAQRKVPMKGWLYEMRRRHHRLSMVGLVLLLLTSLLANVRLTAAGDSPYLIKDSKFPAAEAKLGWLDNERVIFHGYEVGKVGQPSSDDGRPLAETGLFIWNTKKGTVSKYWDIDGPTSLCVYHDTIAFGQGVKGDQKAWIRIVGKVGQQQMVRSTGSDWVNPISCAYSKERPPEVTGQRILRHLREEHGYVDFGPTVNVDQADAARVLLYHSNQKEGMVLPLNPARVLNLIEYSEFENAYVIKGMANTTDAVPVWLLRPEGAVTSIFAPTGKSWEQFGWDTYHPTRKGLFLAGGRGGYAEIGKSGGYLLSGDVPTRLIAGHVRNVSVSPDGCQVAFVHVLHSQAGADSVKALRQGKPGTRTLKMIDFCKGD